MENSGNFYGSSRYFNNNLRLQGPKPQTDLINRILNRQTTPALANTNLPERRLRWFPEGEPPPGQLGGRDDPFRRGLSGACTKWYIRYVRQGCSGEEARRKALDHRQIPGNKRPSDEQPATTDAAKKACATVTDTAATATALKETNKQENPLKTSAKTVADTTAVALESTKKAVIAAAAKEATLTEDDRGTMVVTNINVAIRPVGYPQKMLTSEELSNLKLAILQEIVKGSNVALRFDGIQLKPGYLVVECHGDAPAHWLINVASMLTNWKGEPLEGLIADAIPSSNTMELFLPGSAGASADFLLGLLQVQNRLCTDAWKVISKRDEGDGCLMTIAIDDQSMQSIVANEKIWFRYGTIPTKVLNKPAEDDKKPAAEPVIVTATVDLTEECMEEPAADEGAQQDVAAAKAAAEN